ncbi:MAG: uroporphyrinogen-III synthase [Pseudomonadota bacterium]
MKSANDTLKVVITRPLEQARTLAKKLQSLNIAPVVFPAIEIIPLDKTRQQWVDLKTVDMMIFISVNAVKYGQNHIDFNLLKSLPIKIIAMGAATARALQAAGLKLSVSPSPPFTSEHLLEQLGVLDLSKKHIVIVRGQGGREYLAEQLRQQGAELNYIEVYKRQRPKADMCAMLVQHPDVIVITSNEALQTIYDMTPSRQREALLNCALIVISNRAVTLAKTLGFMNTIHLATGADDEAIISLLKQWRKL